MKDAVKQSGSRFLYEPFDVASVRIDANERIFEERWKSLSLRLQQIELSLERLERRMWLAVYGVAATVLVNIFYSIFTLSGN